MISSVSSALPKDPSSMLAFEYYQITALLFREKRNNGIQSTERQTIRHTVYGVCLSIHTSMLFCLKYTFCCIPGLCSEQLASDSVPHLGGRFPIFPFNISIVPTTLTTNNLREKSLPLGGWISPRLGRLLFMGGEAARRFGVKHILQSYLCSNLWRPKGFWGFSLSGGGPAVCSRELLNSAKDSFNAVSIT